MRKPSKNDYDFHKKGEEIRILELMDEVPSVYEKTGVKWHRAALEYWLSQMESAIEQDDCDGVNFAIATARVREFEICLPAVNHSMLTKSELDKVTTDMLEIIDRQGVLFDKWNDHCVCLLQLNTKKKEGRFFA
jgi:hypothetical protein